MYWVLFQLVPYAVMDVLGFMPGIPGLFVSCIFSASLRFVSDKSSVFTR